MAISAEKSRPPARCGHRRRRSFSSIRSRIAGARRIRDKIIPEGLLIAREKSLDQRQIVARRLHSRYIGTNGIRPGVQRIDRFGLQNDQLPVAGQHRDSGEIEEALVEIVGRTLAARHRDIRSSDGIAVRLPVVCAGDRGNRLPGLGLIGIRVLRPPAPGDVHPLHPLAAAKKQPSRKLTRVEQRVRLTRRRLPLTEVVELRQRRKIVRTQRERLRHALVGVRSADNIDRMHHRPVHRLVVGRLRTAGKHIVVGLRPSQSKHAAERSHQLVLQLHLLRRRGSGATPVQHKDGVLDKARGNNGIDAFGHAVLQAAGRIARTVAQQQIGDRAVAVVDDGDLLGDIVAALHVSRKDKPGGPEKRIRSADMLIERSAAQQHGSRSSSNSPGQ